MLILGLYLDPPFIREALIFKRRNGIEVRSLQTSFLDEELPLAPRPKAERVEGAPPAPPKCKASIQYPNRRDVVWGPQNKCKAALHWRFPRENRHWSFRQRFVNPFDGI